MKRLLLLLWLTGAVLSAPTALDPTCTSKPESEDVTSTWTVTPSSSPCVQSTEIIALQSEIHSVVVDMPQVISLTYASPETWGSLPTSVEEYDPSPTTPVFPSPTTPVLQLAMNQ